MRTIFSLCSAGILISLGLATTSQASVITFSTQATAVDSSENNSQGNNIVIQKNPAWADPIIGSNWISFTNTGAPGTPGFTIEPNGTVVEFYQHFMLSGADLGENGLVQVMADDSASVTLNGHLLLAEGQAAGNHYSTCSDFGVSCHEPITVVLPSFDFVTGINTLTFGLAQRAGSSYGLDYKGAAGSAVPEPATAGMLAIGLGAALCFVRKRKGAKG